MDRMLARFVGKRVGMTTKWVYDMCKDRGSIMKDNFGEWVLTDFGKHIGGKMSNGTHVSVPTFGLRKLRKL